MRHYEFQQDSRTYERVPYPTARRAYDAGQIVIICPVNLRPDSVWVPGVLVDNTGGESFARVVCGHDYYNCIDSETGRYSAYYVEVRA